jgi:hypothetical protein
VIQAVAVLWSIACAAVDPPLLALAEAQNFAARLLSTGVMIAWPNSAVAGSGVPVRTLTTTTATAMDAERVLRIRRFM